MNKDLIDSVKDMTLRDKRILAERVASEIEREERKNDHETLGEMYISIMGDILGRPLLRSRDRDFVYARIVIAVVLYDKGLSEAQIGKILGKDHSTINHYRRTWDDVQTFPKAYADLIWMYNEFKKAINDE